MIPLLYFLHALLVNLLVRKAVHSELTKLWSGWQNLILNWDELQQHKTAYYYVFHIMIIGLKMTVLVWMSVVTIGWVCVYWVNNIYKYFLWILHHRKWRRAETVRIPSLQIHYWGTTEPQEPFLSNERRRRSRKKGNRTKEEGVPSYKYNVVGDTRSIPCERDTTELTIFNMHHIGSLWRLLPLSETCQRQYRG